MYLVRNYGYEYVVDLFFLDEDAKKFYFIVLIKLFFFRFFFNIWRGRGGGSGDLFYFGILCDKLYEICIFLFKVGRN